MIKRHFHDKRIHKGQGLVEFALIIPIFLLLVYGIFEVGRAIFMYSAVLNASRDAVRYASAVGKNSSGTEYYRDCAGIKAHADKVSAFVDLSASDAVTINYDHGPVSASEKLGDISPFASCPLAADKNLIAGDRVVVKVKTKFQPILPILSATDIPISAKTSRTVLVDVDVWNP